MKISCIKHPANQRLIVIHQWQLDFCEGNVAQAALLSFFEYWHNIKLELCAKAQAQGKSINESNLLQYHTEDELIAGILRIVTSRSTIITAVKKLEKRGVISIHKNPNKKMGFDKTKHYRFYPEVVNRWLENHCDSSLSKNEQSEKSITYNAEHCSKPHDSSLFKNEQSIVQICTIDCPKMNNRLSKNAPTRPETSTEASKKTNDKLDAKNKKTEFTGHSNQIASSSSETLSPGGDTPLFPNKTFLPPSETLSSPGDISKTIKTNKTTTKANAVCQSSVDLNIFSSLNWPKNLNKTKPVVMALAKLPDGYARQQVLDVFAQASGKGIVEKPVAYLQKVVQNYLDGDFTPIEKVPAQVPAQPNTPVKTVNDFDPQKHAIDKCPYCDESGIVSIKYMDGGQIRTGALPRCNHKPQSIQHLVEDKQVIEITSALPAHRFDFMPTEEASSQASAQPTSRPDAQTQNHSNDRAISKTNKEKMLDELKQNFHKNRHSQVEKMMEGWDEQTRASELAEFEKATSRNVRIQYKQHGLDSNLAKAALVKHLAKKHLPIEESDFVAWAKTQGHQVESDSNGNSNGNGTHGDGNYRFNSTMPVGNVLKGALSNMERVNGR